MIHNFPVHQTASAYARVTQRLGGLVVLTSLALAGCSSPTQVPPTETPFPRAYLLTDLPPSALPMFVVLGEDQAGHYSADGTLFVTTEQEYEESVYAQVWDAKTGKKLREFLVIAPTPYTQRVGDQHLFDMQVSPDGKTLVIIDDKDVVNIWDVSQGTLIRELGVPAKDPMYGFTTRRAVYSPDGRQILTINQHGYSILWDAQTGEQRVRLDIPSVDDLIGRAAFSPDGKLIAAVTGDTLHLFDTATGKRTPVSYKDPALQGTFAPVQFSPDGRVIAVVGPNTVALVDASQGTLLWSLPTQATSAAFSRDGQSLFTIYNGTVVQWNTSDGTSRGTATIDPRGSALQFSQIAVSPDSQHLVASGSVQRNVYGVPWITGFSVVDVGAIAPMAERAGVWVQSYQGERSLTSEEQTTIDGLIAKIPPEWITTQKILARYELKIVLSNTLIEQCQYSSGTDHGLINRYETRADVTLTDLQTTEILSSTPYMGSVPKETCQLIENLPSSSTGAGAIAYAGGPPDISDFGNWLHTTLNNSPNLVATKPAH